MYYLLTLADQKGIERFNKTLPILGEVNRVEVAFHQGLPFPGNLKKWLFVPRGLDPDEYVVFSDTSDVIFQKPLPEFSHDLYLAPENVTHRDTVWKDHIERYSQFAPLMDKEVYNCGTFAMKVRTMYEYVAFMMTCDDGGYREENLEQMYFNLFIHTRQELSRVIDLSIFCPLYRNVFNTYVHKDNGVWKTWHNNKTISVVHANGDVRLKGIL